MLKIDGNTYNVGVVSLSRTADVLDSYAERTEDGVLHRGIIGVYYNYSLQLAPSTDPAEYARLWRKLTEPVEFHTVTVPDESGEYTFTAYFSSVGDTLMMKRAGKSLWKGLKVNFKAQRPARS